MADLKAVYGLAELAQLMGVRSAGILERTLRKEGVPIRGGKTRRVPKVVWISDLRAAMPEAYDSLVLKLSHEAVRRRITG